MARKPLALGTHGKIRLYGRVNGAWIPKPQLAKGVRLAQWRAITNYRGHDGRTRQIQRDGTSVAVATNNLIAHVGEQNAAPIISSAAGPGIDIAALKAAPASSADRYLLSLLSPVPQVTLGTSLTATSRVIDGVPAYLARIREECTPTTVDRYVSVLKTHVVPDLGRLLFTECTVSRLQQFDAGLVSHRRTKPPAGKKKAPPPSKLSPKARQVVREVVRGMMQIAVEADVLKHNPVASMRRITGGAQTPAKAVAAGAVPAFFAKLDADTRARRGDLPTIIRTLFGLGCRIGEAMALAWTYVNLGNEPIERTAFAGTPEETIRTIPPKHVWINATISEPAGQGTQRTPVKTKRSNRVVAVPEFLYLLLVVRKTADVGDDTPVFPNPGKRTWRSPHAVGAAIASMRGRIGYPDFKSHAGRKTASTVLYANGFTGTDLADQLGHASGDFTRTNYVEPGSVNPHAAVILDRVLSGAAEVGG